MGTDELYKGHLSAKIEGDDQAVVSSRDFESDALTVQDLGFRGGSLNLVCRGPMRRSDELEPTFERDLRFRVLAPKVDKRISGNDPHGASLARSQYGNKRYRRWKSRLRGGRPKTPLDIRQLIREMSVANPLWGAPRIHGELLKLGIDVGQTTGAKDTWQRGGGRRRKAGRPSFAIMLMPSRR
jgi:hypothetical protein